MFSPQGAEAGLQLAPIGWRAGFSLLEVMVALAIIALAATVVAPSLSASVGQASRRAAEFELQASLIALRRAAVRSEQEILAATPIALAVRPGPGQALDQSKRGVTRVDLPAPRGWTVGGDAGIVLRPDGTCKPATVELRDSLGRSFLLGVSETCRIRP